MRASYRELIDLPEVFDVSGILIKPLKICNKIIYLFKLPFEKKTHTRYTKIVQERCTNYIKPMPFLLSSGHYTTRLRSDVRRKKRIVY